MTRRTRPRIALLSLNLLCGLLLCAGVTRHADAQTGDGATEAEAVEGDYGQSIEHRIDKIPEFRLSARDAATLWAFNGFHCRLVIAPDGHVAQIVSADHSKDMPAEVVKRVEDTLLALRYKPFEVNGRAIWEKVLIDIDFLPEELKPTVHVPFPDVDDPDAPSKLEITLQRSQCYGTCPAYTLHIFGDGRVEYEGRKFVGVEGRQTDQISAQAVEALVARFREADFYSLEDKYVASVTDMPTYQISIRISDRVKTVTDYSGRDVGMPEIVAELENAIDKAADSGRWVNRQRTRKNPS